MSKQDTLPIDIQYHKLIDVLIDRKIIPKNWSDNIRSLRTDIDNVLGDMPDVKEITQILEGKYLHYFNCKRIMQLLEDSHEGKTTNFFGQYTSSIMRSWYNILKAYEKNNVYVGEIARILIQNTSYEIPSMKKVVQQSEKQITDNNRRINEYHKNIGESKKKLEISCKEMGIQGDNYEMELRQQAKKLPCLFHDFTKVVCDDIIADACSYHAALQEYLHDCEEVEVPTKEKGNSKRKGKKKSTKEVRIIPRHKPQLKALIELRIASFEFEFNENEEMIVEKKIIEEENPKEISWDCDITTTTTSSTNENEITMESEGISLDFSSTSIDWDTVASTTNEVAEINWDITDETISSTSIDLSLNNTTNMNEIQKEISINDEIDWEITTCAVGEEEDENNINTKGKTRVELLMNSDFRKQIHYNLLELDGFLSQRIIELQSDDGVSYSNQFQGTAAILAKQNIQEIYKYQEAVKKALTELNSKYLNQMIMIQQSNRFLDRLVQTFQQKQSQIKKLYHRITELEERNEELIQLVSKNRPILKQITENTIELKKQLEEVFPSMFKGYQVHIIGEINNL